MNLKTRKSTFNNKFAVSIALFFLIILNAFLTACGGSEATATPGTLPDAKTLASAATDKLATINSLHFLVDIQKGEVPIIEGITFRKAEGNFLKPNSYQAKMKVGVVIGQVDADIVAVGEDQYIKVNGMINNWKKLPADVGFKPAEIFDSEKGLGMIIKKVQDLKTVGSDSIDGTDCWHLSGTVDGIDISVLTAKTLDKSRVAIDVWVGKNDSIVRKTTFKEITDSSDKGTYWVLTFSKFDEPVTINKPAGV